MRVLVIEPPQPVVELEEALAHLKVDAGVEDDLIVAMIAAATGHVEEWTQRAIGDQLLEARYSAFETCGPLRLSRPPAVELVSVTWVSEDRQEHVADPADVELIDREVFPVGAAPWSGRLVRDEALRVRYRAGYEALPDQMRSAILLMTSFLYHNRGAQTAVPPAAVAILLQPFKVYA